MAVDLFMDRFLRESGDDQERMQRAASQANQEIFQKAATDEDCTGMGTTLVAALAGVGEAVILNEGDSRAYHINGDGIVLITRDQDVYKRQVEERSPQTVSEYRAKLEARMNEVLSNTQLDPARILTEAAIFADKVAVDEETVRLHSHIGQLREMLDRGGAMGRKLDFLIQEFNREANTIGSKCSDIDIARQVVDIKAEIEKIREQVQNIE